MIYSFLSEINSENNKRDVITFVIFIVCKNGIFMNSGLKVLQTGLRCSILSKITARMLTFGDRTADVTYCADVTLFLHTINNIISHQFIGTKLRFYRILCRLHTLNKTKLTRNG